jgi:hypothetical protein
MKVFRLLPLVLLALAGIPVRVQAQVPPNPAIACFQGLPDREDLKPIASKVWLGLRKDQPFTMMTITDKVTDADRPALLAWVNATQECTRQGAPWLQQYLPPQFGSIIERATAKFLANVADLYAGKITYGDFAKKRIEDGSASDKEWAEAVEHFREQQAEAQQRQAEAQARAQAQRNAQVFQYLLNRSQPQPYPQPYVPQPIQPYHPPMTTTCRAVGNTLQCTTQ